MPPVLIPAGTAIPSRTDGNFTIYTDPQVSTNQLAQFLVADSAKKERIVRDARRVSRIRVTNYNHARSAVTRSHTPEGITLETLDAQIALLQANPGNDEGDLTCLELSIRALRRMRSLLAGFDSAGLRIVRPRRGFDHLGIEGVRVSVQPEVVFSFYTRQRERLGAVLVNFSSGAGSSLAPVSGRYTAGNYAAYLIFEFLSLQFAGHGMPDYRSCYSVDIYRDQIHVSPAALVTTRRNVEAACRAIVALWNRFDLEEDDDVAAED
jgi:hypothetical protein